MFNDHISNLKKLKRTPVPPEALDRGRIRLMALMATHPMPKQAKGFGWLSNALVWKPLTAVFIGAAALTGAGGVVSAAGSALPGEKLYRFKLLAEDMRVRLALSDESRFLILAEQAEVRLTEAERVMKTDRESPEEREGRLQEAMDRYQNQIRILNTLSETFDDSEESLPRAVSAAEAIDKVLERHVTLIDSASTTELESDAVVEQARPTLEISERVHKAVNSHDEKLQRSKKRIETMRIRLNSMDARKARKAEAIIDRQKKKMGEHEDNHASHDHVDPDEASEPAPSASLRLKTQINAETNIHITSEAGVSAEPANLIRP
jgi:hypothetical protein